MILGIEIALTVFGLLYLIRGRGFGEHSTPHPQYRWLGALALSVLPVAFTVTVAVGIMLMITNPQLTPEALESEHRWTLMGVEAGVVLTYAAAVTLWERSIKRRAARESGSAPEPSPPFVR